MSVRAKRWNEHVKLLATSLNVASLGILGVGVVGPVFGPGDGLTSLAERLYSVPWETPLASALLHVSAQITLRLIVEE